METLKFHAESCLKAAIGAVEPSRLVAAALERTPIPATRQVYVLATGKAGQAMLRGAEAALGPQLCGGLLVVPVGSSVEVPSSIEVIYAEHPLPGQGSLTAGRRVRDFCRSLSPSAHVLALISGGSSSLVTLPSQGIVLQDIRATTLDLLAAGATIDELNAVRKHLDDLKGGGLARLLEGSSVRALLLSDVVGDRLDVIASGPLTPDPTTYADALAVLQRYRLVNTLPDPVLKHLKAGVEGARMETPTEGEACFARVDQEVVGNGALAAHAAAEAARALGYSPRVVSTQLVGEAREVGAQLGQLAKRVQAGVEGPHVPACLIAAGETTVTVRGPGRGGRNLELVLGAALDLQGAPGIAIGSVGTDGVDGTSDAAGAIALPDSLARSRAAGLDAAGALRDNNSHAFFEKLGDSLRTGPTGTNVGDVQVLIVQNLH